MFLKHTKVISQKEPKNSLKNNLKITCRSTILCKIRLLFRLKRVKNFNSVFYNVSTLNDQIHVIKLCLHNFQYNHKKEHFIIIQIILLKLRNWKRKQKVMALLLFPLFLFNKYVIITFTSVNILKNLQKRNYSQYLATLRYIIRNW